MLSVQSLPQSVVPLIDVLSVTGKHMYAYMVMHSASHMQAALGKSASKALYWWDKAYGAKQFLANKHLDSE